MRGTQVSLIAAATVAGLALFPASASATTNQQSYFITVSPTSQDPGQSVNVTGNGQYYTEPYSGDNCDSTAIYVTVTYYDITKTQRTSTTTLGTSDGDGDIGPDPVTIPSGAAPTSYTGHDAEVQAYCSYSGATYLSQQVGVDVLGTVPPTTTTTTTTTTTVPATTTTTVPATTAPPTPAPAAEAVTAQPKLTG